MRNMEGKEYWHGKYSTVQVIKQPNYKAGGPRNILIRTKADGYYIVPQRSLRKLKGADWKKRIENLNFRLARSDSCHAEKIMRDFAKELERAKDRKE